MEYKTSIEGLANAYGKQSADLKAAMKEIETLRQLLAEEAAYLVDHYRNGIKYDEDRNEYICIWTQKQIDDAEKEASEIVKKLKW